MTSVRKEGILTPGATNSKNLQQGIGPELMYALMIIHKHHITKTVSMIVLREGMVIFGATLEQSHGVTALQKVFWIIYISGETRDINFSLVF